jgi:hypothetical protein
MLDSVYLLEHPDHVCTVHYFSPEEEEERMNWMRYLDILRFEKLGVVDHLRNGFDEEVALVQRSSRPMVPLERNDQRSYMSVDHAKKTLAADSSDYTWMSRRDSGSRVFIRFVPYFYPSLVFRSYCLADYETPKATTVPLFIQETMIRPICSLSIDSDDDTYSEYAWRESLGEVEAEVSHRGTMDVRLSDASDLIRECSRKMLLVSDQMAPKYIPRNWLESADPNLDLRTSRMENGSAGYLVH